MSSVGTSSLQQLHSRAKIVRKVWERKEERERITRDMVQKLEVIREIVKKDESTS